MTDAAADAAPGSTPGGKAYYVTTPIYYVNDAAAHRARLHDRRGRRADPVAPAARRGRLVPHRHRRARREGPARGRGGREDAAGVDRRPGRDRLEAASCETVDVANDDFIRTTEPRHMRRVQEFWPRLNDKGDVYQGSYEGPYCVAVRGVQARERAGRRRERRASCAPSTAARSSGCRSRTTSSGSRRTPTGCSRSTRRTPIRPARERPQRGRLLREGRACRTCRSRGRRSTGASRSRGTTSTSSTSGSTRCSTTSPPPGTATRPRPRSSPAPGRRTCTWSARTSCGSTR